jgi:hypothetical protein
MGVLNRKLAQSQASVRANEKPELQDAVLAGRCKRNEEERRHGAAGCIQASWRRYMMRRRHREMLVTVQEVHSHYVLQGIWW